MGMALAKLVYNAVDDCALRGRLLIKHPNQAIVDVGAWL